MQQVGLTILHSNDMHGRRGAMARLSTAASKLRSSSLRAGRDVVFWDAGDALDRRDRLCGLSKGAALAGVLNAMGYDLMTMGNDILLTYGPEAMAALVLRLAFPVLAANCRDGDAPPAAGLGESALIQLPSGLRLGVVGVTAPWNGVYAVFGLRFPDTQAVVDRIVRQLHAGGAQLVAVLSHLGLPDDRALAGTVPGIDLIVGAHTHDLLERGVEENGVLIVQAGEFAETLGVVEVEVDLESGNVLSRVGRVVRVLEDETPDPRVIQAFARAEDEVNALAAQPIAVLSGDLELDYLGECSLGDLAADALRDRMQAEAAVLVSGQFHTGLRAGPVTLEDLCQCSSSTANPQRSRVRGSQIVEALERGLDPALIESRPHGLRGAQVGWPQISGLQVEFDPAGHPGGRILNVRLGDRQLDPQREYWLAHTDVESETQAPILLLEPGQETRIEVPTITREFLADYLRAHSPAAAPSGARWIRRS